MYTVFAVLGFIHILPRPPPKSKKGVGCAAFCATPTRPPNLPSEQEPHRVALTTRQGEISGVDEAHTRDPK